MLALAQRLHQPFQRAYLIQGMDLGRYIARILENAVSHAQIFRHQQVFFEIERLPGSWKTFEIASR